MTTNGGYNSNHWRYKNEQNRHNSWPLWCLYSIGEGGVPGKPTEMKYIDNNRGDHGRCLLCDRHNVQHFLYGMPNPHKAVLNKVSNKKIEAQG